MSPSEIRKPRDRLRRAGRRPASGGAGGDARASTRARRARRLGDRGTRHRRRRGAARRGEGLARTPTPRCGRRGVTPNATGSRSTSSPTEMRRRDARDADQHPPAPTMRSRSIRRSSASTGDRPDRGARAGTRRVSTTADEVWAVGRPTIGTAVELAARLQVYGKERVPLNGGVVIACNHFHWVDPPALGAACPRTIYFMAKVEAHRVPGSRSLHPRFRHLPRATRRVRPRRGANDARRSCATGSRSASSPREHGRRAAIPGELQPGAAMVALQEDVPVDSGRDPRLADVEARQLPPDLARLGRADHVRRGCRRVARATRRRRPSCRRRSASSSTSSSSMHGLGRPDGVPPR